MVDWVVGLVVSTWLLSVLVEPELEALLVVEVVVDLEWKELIETVAVVPTVGCESWIGCVVVDSAARSLVEAH